MAKHSSLDPKQRTEAVLALLRREEPATQIARRYGVSEKTLYAWRDEFIAGGQQALASGKQGSSREEKRIAQLEKRIEQRDRVIGEITIANRILKKISKEMGLPTPSDDV